MTPYTSSKIDASFGNSHGCFCVSMTLRTPPMCNGWTSDVWRRDDFNLSIHIFMIYTCTRNSFTLSRLSTSLKTQPTSRARIITIPHRYKVNMEAQQGHSKACCNVPPAVSKGYKEKGKYIDLNGMQCYATGPSNATSAIFIIYDIFGFSPQAIQGADILAHADSSHRTYSSELIPLVWH